MAEPCEFCGRFMKHVWFLSDPLDPNSWEDYWECSLNAKHMVDHPWAYRHDPTPPDFGTST